MQFWAFAVGAWVLTVGLLLALLRQRLKDMREGADLEGALDDKPPSQKVITPHSPP